MTPILNSALTTSPPLSASFWARSPTVMASPMVISRTIGAVGRVKPVPLRDWSSERRCFGRPREAPRRARSGALRCNWPAKRAALSSSSIDVTIACEPRLGAALPLPLCAAALSSTRGGGRLRVAMVAGLRLGGFLDDDGFGCGGGGHCGGLAFALGGFLFEALALIDVGLPLGVGLGQALLLAEVALARFLELAQDLGALGIGLRDGGLRGGRAVDLRGAVSRLGVRALLADLDGHGALGAAGGDRHFLHLAAVERDLLRRVAFLGRRARPCRACAAGNRAASSSRCWSRPGRDR